MFAQLISTLKKSPKTIVFTEGTDPRILEASARLLSGNFLKPVLVGNPDEIAAAAEDIGFNIRGAEIIDPENYDDMDEMVDKMVELRKGKMTADECRAALKKSNYFGTMLVKMGKADCLLGGATYSTADTVRPALQLIKTKPGNKIVSSCFIMVRPAASGENEVLAMADCAINIKPNEDELVEICKETVSCAKIFGVDPKVAFLSYSTLGSGKGEDVDKMRNACEKAKALMPDTPIGGEFQFDAAVSPAVAKTKHITDAVGGHANTFIFPDINAGNIGYKIAQRLGSFDAYGPILLGLNAPINDLSRGCNAQEVYLVAALILSRGWFSFPMLAVFCFIIGSINSIYYVAYDSFYPLLISEGNYSKAYSIASVLETLSALIIPIATYFYNLFGIAPLIGINALCFFIAATAETQIRAEEHYIEKQRAALALEEQHSSGRQLLRDIKEGFRYLMSEKGLLRVAIYFTFSMLASGASQVITLPYFKSTFDNGEYIYMLVWGMAIFGRAIGGGIHYKIKLPVQHKYSIALMVYVVISLCEGFYLYCPLPVMMVSCFLTGILGVTSYTIRISATQSYVPDEKKGRFNGAFNMLNTVGSFTGNLLAGALVAFLPVRGVLTGFMLVTAAAAVVVIGGGRRDVSAIYNRQE